MLRTIAAAAAVLVALAVPTAAAPASPEAAAHWRALTEMDLEAAYALVRDNHPAAVAEVGDDAFRAALDRAIATGRERTARVDSYAGYAAVLNGFAVSLGDKHIWSRQIVRPAVYQWTGLAIARRGDSWRVAADARGGDQPSLLNARLVSCDGRTADELAEERLGGFRAVWSVEAQRIQTAPWILIDDGNPFLQRPKACTFDIGTGETTVQLEWRGAGPVTLSTQLAQAVRIGDAGFGVRKFAGGYWIGIRSLDDRARPVIEAARAQLADIRKAPMVVLDLRGNGGGNSAFTSELASLLMGDRYVGRYRIALPNGCGETWRATAGNLEGIRTFIRENSAGLNADSRRYLADVEKGLAEAVNTGKPFDRPIAGCARPDAPEPAPGNGDGSLLNGRMIILTDNACFSSCLLAVQEFRRLGALHVGEATDAATRYMEVREIVLPSGLSYASTLQKVAFGAPSRIGPFTPARAFDGDIADTSALEAWVADLR